MAILMGFAVTGILFIFQIAIATAVHPGGKTCPLIQEFNERTEKAIISIFKLEDWMSKIDSYLDEHRSEVNMMKSRMEEFVREIERQSKLMKVAPVTKRMASPLRKIEKKMQTTRQKSDDLLDEMLESMTSSFESKMDRTKEQILRSFDDDLTDINERIDRLNLTMHSNRKTPDTYKGCPPWAVAMNYTYNATVNVCYAWRKNKETHPSASEKCLEDGGHLLLVANSAIHEWVIDLVDDLPEGAVWVDGTDEISEGDFRNYRNQSITNLMWEGFEPNGQRNENCVSVFWHPQHQLNDASCSTLLEFVCQIDV